MEERMKGVKCTLKDSKRTKKVRDWIGKLARFGERKCGLSVSVDFNHVQDRENTETT